LKTWFENGAGIVGRPTICDTGTLIAAELMAVVCETSSAPTGAEIVAVVSLLSCSEIEIVIGFEEFGRLLVDDVPAEVMEVVTCEIFCAAVGAEIVIAGSILSGSEFADVVTAFDEFAT